MPTPSLNGYALTDKFRKLRARQVFTHLEAYLFFELVALCNDAEWPAEFTASNKTLEASLGCSEKAVIKCRETLRKAGLIDFTEGQNRRPTTYRFQPVKGLPQVSVSEDKGLPEVSDYPAEGLPEGLPQVSVSDENDGKHLPEGLPKGLPEVSPYKEQTKTKTISSARRTDGKNDGFKNDAKNDAPPDVSFAQFWDAFGKKVDRVKSEKAWAKLGPATRLLAFAQVPAYVAQKPDPQYRKNPLTWLNGQCWLDEGIPAGPAASAAPHPSPAPVHTPDLNYDFINEQEAAAAAARTARLDKYANASA